MIPEADLVLPPRPGYGALYLANQPAANSPALLQRLSIQSLLSCTITNQVSPPPGVLHKHVTCLDSQDFDIVAKFKECLEFIDYNLRRGNVMVHCLVGVSRSATVVIAYLMHYLQMPFQEAYKEVKACRGKINPNKGFMEQLGWFGEQLRLRRGRV